MTLQVGEMLNFNHKPFIDAAEELVRADEIIRALHLLDNLPAYYRDNPIKEVEQLKRDIIGKICTPTTYAQNAIDIEVAGNGMQLSLRGMLITKEVKLLNDKGIEPQLVDYGPGEYWLPIILKEAGLKFSYKPIYLNVDAHTKAFNKFSEEFLKFDKNKDVPKIFIACEIIEHLWQEREIKTEMLREMGLADIIHISTPKYTFDGVCQDWRKKDLGHLRAYTPNEFIQTLAGMFNEYDLEVVDSVILHARLVLKSNKFGFNPKDIGSMLS